MLKSETIASHSKYAFLSSLSSTFFGIASKSIFALSPSSKKEIEDGDVKKRIRCDIKYHEIHRCMTGIIIVQDLSVSQPLLSSQRQQIVNQGHIKEEILASTTYHIQFRNEKN